MFSAYPPVDHDGLGCQRCGGDQAVFPAPDRGQVRLLPNYAVFMLVPRMNCYSMIAALLAVLLALFFTTSSMLIHGGESAATLSASFAAW